MVYAMADQSRSKEGSRSGLTSRNAVHLVSDEEVDQRYKRRKEGSSKELPILDGGGVARAQGEAAKGPWQSGHQIRDHEDVVPVVVIGRCDVCPSSTGQCSEDANASDEFGEGRVRSAGQNVPETNECESRT